MRSVGPLGPASITVNHETRPVQSLIAALVCAATTLGQSSPGTLPASQPGETIVAARQRLARIKSSERSDPDRALLTALDFALAIGVGDVHKANGLIDVVGYQALPLAGDLPEKPDKPLAPPAIERLLAALPKIDVGTLPASCAAVVTHKELRDEFPAVATWMLPQDQAVVFQPAPGNPLETWLRRAACLVVRIRAERATIIGGNFLQALTAAAEAAAPTAEDK
jgi:hypothetical protein